MSGQSGKVRTHFLSLQTLSTMSGSPKTHTMPRNRALLLYTFPPQGLFFCQLHDLSRLQLAPSLLFKKSLPILTATMCAPIWRRSHCATVGSDVVWLLDKKQTPL
jgi:hypothetical protein